SPTVCRRARCHGAGMTRYRSQRRSGSDQFRDSVRAKPAAEPRARHLSMSMEPARNLIMSSVAANRTRTSFSNWTGSERLLLGSADRLHQGAHATVRGRGFGSLVAGLEICDGEVP